jgi:hypothetical protein
MEFDVRDVRGQRFVEGVPGQPLIRHVEDVTTLLEACFANAAHGLLLYPENLTEHFFDLSSGEAGTILQKLRNYHIRLAVVRSPTLRLSRHFGELIADEQRGPYFRLFDERSVAQEWLCAL